MKRSAIWCYFVLCTILLISCTNNRSPETSKEPPASSMEAPDSSAESTEPPASPAETPVASTESPTNSAGEPFFALIDEGKVGDTEFAIGDSTELLWKQKGEPEMTDYFEGGQYFNYGTVTYFTDATMDESNELVHGHIGYIGLASGHEVFGLKLGEANAEQMESALGTNYVIQSPEENSDSYLLSGMWSYEYRAEHYSLIFYSDHQDGVINGALYMRNSK